jgi:hypothetical protein
LAPSGWSYKRTFVLCDRETGTLWYPQKGGLLGIQGEYFQRLLPAIDSQDTQWSQWIKANPESKLMR